jgi:hypothetical protein
LTIRQVIRFHKCAWNCQNDLDKRKNAKRILVVRKAMMSV